jgi:hypothetical protein
MSVVMALLEQIHSEDHPAIRLVDRIARRGDRQNRNVGILAAVGVSLRMRGGKRRSQRCGKKNE